MPISDLLAEISGEKAGPTTSTSSSGVPGSKGVKRKADGDTGSSLISKVQRTQSNGQQNGLVSRPALARPPSPPSSRPSTSVAKPPTANQQQRPGAASSTSLNGASRPYTGTASLTRPNPPIASLKKEAPRANERPKTLTSATGPAKTAPVKPSPSAPAASESSKAPKKGSFAEIMARGAKAQQVMPKAAGVIQHKPLEKSLPKKEREKIKANPKNLANEKGPAAVSRGGARPGNAPRDGPRNGLSKDPKTNGKSTASSSGGSAAAAAAAAAERKKKAATTGYTGTARPPSKKSTESRGASSARRPAGGLLAPPKSARRGHFDEEYDEDLDDFVVDDEDEDDPYAQRYDYASDVSSDMEAGMDDIYDEESKAEKFAKLEDRREEALLEKLKREKEAKKRMGYR